jgi:hypothetical protein
MPKYGYSRRICCLNSYYIYSIFVAVQAGFLPKLPLSIFSWTKEEAFMKVNFDLKLDIGWNSGN